LTVIIPDVTGGLVGKDPLTNLIASETSYVPGPEGGGGGRLGLEKLHVRVSPIGAAPAQ
jgi:hypothetical protein